LRHLFDPDHPSYHATERGWMVSDLADAAAASGHIAEAKRFLVGLEADEMRSEGTWWRVGIAYARAVLTAQGDDASASGRACGDALSVNRERWPLALARRELAHGTWLRRQRRVVEARTALRTARDLLDAIGVRYLGDRARRELGAGGEGGHRRGIDAIDQLTPQELQIARMAGDGLSNREIGAQLFLSHRTVGFHLYQVFPKLGIT